MDAAAPLLCAGITTYSPLRHFGLVRGCPPAALLTALDARLPPGTDGSLPVAAKSRCCPAIPALSTPPCPRLPCPALQDKPGTKVGVIGLGGLGHMAVKLAKAFGCEVRRAACNPPASWVPACRWVPAKQPARRPNNLPACMHSAIHHFKRSEACSQSLLSSPAPASPACLHPPAFFLLVCQRRSPSSPPHPPRRRRPAPAWGQTTLL
jgi:hypothetical protein